MAIVMLFFPANHVHRNMDITKRLDEHYSKDGNEPFRRLDATPQFIFVDLHTIFSKWGHVLSAVDRGYARAVSLTVHDGRRWSESVD